MIALKPEMQGENQTLVIQSYLIQPTRTEDEKRHNQNTNQHELKLKTNRTENRTNINQSV